MWIVGFSDLQQHSLTEKQASAPCQFAGRASAVRGQDATGNCLRTEWKTAIYKRPKPAARMQLRLPKGTTQLLGHVRMTTQGRGRKTITIIRSAVHCPAETLHWPTTVYCITKRAFACGFNLPQTAVETDSFVAVQLLQKLWRGDTADHYCYGRTVGGTFTFSDFRK